MWFKKKEEMLRNVKIMKTKQIQFFTKDRNTEFIKVMTFKFSNILDGKSKKLAERCNVNQEAVIRSTELINLKE